jgi:hypothetical protein
MFTSTVPASTAPTAAVRPVMTPEMADLYAHALKVGAAAVIGWDGPPADGQETADRRHELEVSALVVDLIATEYDLP